MKKTLLIFFLIIVNFTYAEAAPIQISDFFKLVFLNEDNNLNFYINSDSMPGNAEYTDFAKNMYAFNNYLVSNLSDAYNQMDYLESLLPDTTKIKSEFCKFLNGDKEYSEIFFKSLYKDKINDINIDSILNIASKFFYVHKVDGKVAYHFCVGINGLNHIEKNDNENYYRAFCFMTIFDQIDPDTIMNTAIAEFESELNDSISEIKLKEIQNKVYYRVAKINLLREAIIAEYEKKKNFLNFKILY